VLYSPLLDRFGVAGGLLDLEFELSLDPQHPSGPHTW
jgi:hypothetical protein